MKTRQPNLDGIKLCAVDLNRAVNIVDNFIGKGRGDYFCLVNVHLFTVATKDHNLKLVLNESAGNFPDGMGIAWALKLLGYSFKGRVRGTDLMLSLCQFAQKSGLRIFLYGSRKENLSILTKILKDSFKGINIVGSVSPPFRCLSKEEDNRVIDLINSSGADILFVSLGAPKQEKWMYDHIGRIRPVQLGVGAAFDFITGVVRQAPVWMQNLGLEWLYRLPQQPKKTTSRMLLAPGFFLKTIIEVSRKRRNNNAT